MIALAMAITNTNKRSLEDIVPLRAFDSDAIDELAVIKYIFEVVQLRYLRIKCEHKAALFIMRYLTG